VSQNHDHISLERPTLRELTPADAGSVAALWLVCTREVAETEPIYTPAVTHDELEELLSRELQSGARLGWAAFDGERLAAYVTCRIEQESAAFAPRRFVYIIDLDVAPTYRRKGLSGRLLSQVEGFARSKGIDRLELAFAAADPRARAVWERHGFQSHLVYMHRRL